MVGGEGLAGAGFEPDFGPFGGPVGFAARLGQSIIAPPTIAARWVGHPAGLDFNIDVDDSDLTLFHDDSGIPKGLSRQPGRTATSINHPFAHQGLLYEHELESYQNRARQYLPIRRRFVQSWEKRGIEDSAAI